jgi:predicted ABC-type ATPase
VIVAGHNGSGKSTMWKESLADALQIPLINADRMMLSILPEPGPDGFLTPWAETLRDQDQDWMGVAQRGVAAFVGHAMSAKAPFAMETVFSHWRERPDGTAESKIDLIRDMQSAGYFVLLLFVGLATADLSVLRVQTRVSRGGHAVDEIKLRQRFPRTQKAIGAAIRVADAAVLTDNSGSRAEAFMVCRVQFREDVRYDLRALPTPPPASVRKWMDMVAPLTA